MSGFLGSPETPELELPTLELDPDQTAASRDRARALTKKGRASTISTPLRGLLSSGSTRSGGTKRTVLGG